ncbi:MAG: cytochrome c peroxidase [Solimonas sp.]
MDDRASKTRVVPRRRLAAGIALLSLFAHPAHADLPPDGEIGTTRLRYSVVMPPMRFDAPAPLVALGEQIFFDAALSEPRGLSCAGCHDPRRAFSGTRASERGVAAGSRPDRFGTRNVPSLLYVRYVPPLYFWQDDDDHPAPEPRGGLFADGRVDTLAALPATPLLSPLEMNNRDAATIARKLARAPYAKDFVAAFGADIFARPDATLAALGRAIAAYLQSDTMAPFSSRYDAYIRGQATLSAEEMRGLALFRSQTKGNCASCHAFNDSSSHPARSLFTDFGYDATAAPRNGGIPLNRDRRHYDLGLCETASARSWPESATWCGYFRTPGLRNVAVRARYMHNGAFRDLRSVVAFYATRATSPRQWYPSGVRFDDLPAALRVNVNVNAVPYNRREGASPALDERDVDAIVAFLRTLTDAPYVSMMPASSSQPAVATVQR